MPTIDERIAIALRNFKPEFTVWAKTVFTGGTPSATVATLDGTGAAGSSADYSRGDHKHADANRPSSGQKDALAGTQGTPSSTNKYVTNDDTRVGIGGASGALVLLESHAASASASLDFTTRNKSGLTGATFQSDFDEYIIEFINLIPAADAVPQMRMSTDGGSTFAAGTAYSYAAFVWTASATGQTGSEGGTAQISLMYDNGVKQKAISTWGLIGSLRLLSPLSTALHKQVVGQTYCLDDEGTPKRVGSNITGAYESTTAVNAFRFFYAGQNITSGEVRVYGVAK